MNPASKEEWLYALRKTYPVATGYYPAGMAFGILMAAQDLPLWLTTITALILYSGAAQYASIPLYASGASVFTMSINAFVINLRHVFYALPLIERYPKGFVKRNLCFFWLTDETFSLLTSLPKEKGGDLFLKISFLNYFYWCSACVVGGLLGSEVNEYIPNLDFALICLFVVLWLDQFLSKRVLRSTVAGVVAYFAAMAMSHDFKLLLAVGMSVLWILVDALVVDPIKSGARVSAREAKLEEGKATQQESKSGWFSTIDLGLVIMAALILVVSIVLLKKSGLDVNAISEKGVRSWVTWIVACFVMGFLTFLLRAAPAIIPKVWFKSRLLMRVNEQMPLAVLAILILAAFNFEKLIVAGEGTGEVLARVAALVIVGFVYKFTKSVLACMVLGILSLNLILLI